MREWRERKQRERDWKERERLERKRTEIDKIERKRVKKEIYSKNERENGKRLSKKKEKDGTEKRD